MALTPGTLKYALNVDIEGEFYQWFVVGDLILVTFLVAHRGYLLLRIQAGWNWYPLRKIIRLIKKRGAHDESAATLPAVPDDPAGSQRSHASRAADDVRRPGLHPSGGDADPDDDHVVRAAE
jgi:hypothetical protein